MRTVKWVTAFILAFCYFIPPSANADYIFDDVETLRGIASLYVYVHNLPPDLEEFGFTREKIQSDVIAKLEAADIEVLKEARRENIRCYVVQITPDLAELFQLLMNQMQASLGEISSSELEQISQMFHDFSVKMWIEKDTYHVLFADIMMKIEATPEMMGEYDQEGLFSINATMNMKAYDYNESVEIVLPAEADEAEEDMIMW